MLEEFSEQGIFWLPNRQDDVVAGTLSFDPEKGINLSLVGSLPGLPHVRQHFRVIHGNIRGKDLTLLQCLSAGGVRFGFSSMSYEAYKPRTLLLGHALAAEPETFIQGSITTDDSGTTTVTDSDDNVPEWTTHTELRFDYARIELMNLAEWVQRAGANITSSPKPPRRITFSYTQPDPERASFSRGEIELFFGYSASGIHRDGFRFDPQPSLILKYEEPQTLSQIFADTGSLQNFLTLCTDRGCNIKNLYVGTSEIPVLSAAGTILAPRKEIEVIGQMTGYVDSGSNFLPERDAVISYDNVGGISTVANWLDRSSDLQLPLGSLLSIRYGRPLYVENRLLNTTFAAEAYHRITVGGSEMPDDQFNELYTLAVDAIPEEHREWMRNTLKYANTPTLRRRLDYLGKRTRPAIRAVLGDVSKWAYAVATTRNYLTHLDKYTAKFDGATLHWLSESVFSTVRVSLLMDCGIDGQTLTDLGSTQPMLFLARRVGPAVRDARETIKALADQ